MNILVISHEYPPIGGGGANACYFLSREYARLGHKVTVVTSTYKDLPLDEMDGDVHIIRVKAKRTKEDKSTFMEMFSYLKSAYFYADKLCKKEKFDVCQVYFGIPSGPIGVHLKKKYGIPYIVRFGGGDIPGAQKRFAVIYKVLTPFIRSIWKNADMLVANSEVLRERARNFEDRYPIEIIANGVDSEFFTKNPNDASNRDITSNDRNTEEIPVELSKEVTKDGQHNRESHNILFVSRLIKGKGLQYIIPRMKEINEKTGALLTIVGDGPYKEELQRITAENNVENLVSFEGRKNKRELYDYYSNADLFILPSESEGMPNVVLEAMSMELPIVMTPCGGSKELIDGNGVVIEIDGFVESVIKVLSDEALRQQYGKESARRARELFSWSKKAKEYVGLFEKSMKIQ